MRLCFHLESSKFLASHLAIILFAPFANMQVWHNNNNKKFNQQTYKSGKNNTSIHNHPAGSSASGKHFTRHSKEPSTNRRPEWGKPGVEATATIATICGAGLIKSIHTNGMCQSGIFHS